MRMHLIAATAASLCASAALAGGIERAAFSSGFLFEEGSYAEVSFGSVSPSVSGTLGGGALASGDMLGSYTNLSLSYKRQVSDKLSLGLIVNQPVGADVAYPAGTGYPFAGTTAQVDAIAVTGLARYEFAENLSVFGGLRAERLSGVVNDLPLPGPVLYDLSTGDSTELGYVVGVAWEKPEIAARVALSYESERAHSLSSSESFGGGPAVPGSFTTIIPQTVNLEFQTGIMADTLLFGSVRWAEWSAFDITPPAFFGATGSSLAFYSSDTTTYNLGVGRRFNEKWSGAIILGYEEQTGDIFGNLGPTDGFKSIGAAVTYTHGKVKITGGIRYVEIGDTTTTVGADFSNNDAIAAGIRVAYNF